MAARRRTPKMFLLVCILTNIILSRWDCGENRRDLLDRQSVRVAGGSTGQERVHHGTFSCRQRHLQAVVLYLWHDRRARACGIIVVVYAAGPDRKGHEPPRRPHG